VTLSMYDSIENGEFPKGAAAYAAYVDGHLGDQPNYAHVVAAFPGARHLSIALFPGHDADVLDVENGAAGTADVPGWHARQVRRGIARPVVYASAYTMDAGVLPVLSAAGIARASVRLWTAHYEVGQHICGPDSCRALSVNADGTQWTPNAVVNGATLVLDQSLLLENFFTTDPTVTTEAEVQSGQLNNGKNALTAIACATSAGTRSTNGSCGFGRCV